MKLLIEEGFVEETPESVAKFLRTTEGLDKTMVGDYLGEKYLLHLSPY
jgi:Sec7-like guanine-nucleotide exchange factor